jgi:hypothetical protein
MDDGMAEERRHIVVWPGSSRTPALMIAALDNDSAVRKSVAPQSGQK